MEFIVRNLLTLIQIYGYVLIAYVIMSWVPDAHGSRFYGIIFKLCDPYLSVFRRYIPRGGAIDFVPLIGFLALRVISTLLSNLL